MPGACPLSQEHCDALTQALRAVVLAREIAQKCQAAGVDMSEQLSRLDQIEQAASSLKRTFFPDQP